MNNTDEESVNDFVKYTHKEVNNPQDLTEDQKSAKDAKFDQVRRKILKLNCLY